MPCTSLVSLNSGYSETREFRGHPAMSDSWNASAAEAMQAFGVFRFEAMRKQAQLGLRIPGASYIDISRIQS